MSEQLIDLLSTAAHRFKQQLRDAVQATDHPLTHFETRVLVTVAHHTQLTQQAAAAHLECDKAQLARAIKVLESQELIARTPNADDWRARDLALTTQGHLVFLRLRKLRAGLADDCLQDLSAQEQAQLAALLGKIAGRLSAADAPSAQTD
jgi:DNA-binding MarR family transcriptional regulator